ncbi:MAG TPA: hypothetical protein VM577_06825 [Anaerovoracaceae bacterium]|nr:hypothetical protein [Anaerovoracaceae bacterium]
MEWYDNGNYYHTTKRVRKLLSVIIREHPQVIWEDTETEHLELLHCDIRSLSALHKMKNLQYLSLVGCEMSDSLDSNERFEGVEYLYVCSQSDADFNWLKCFPNLCELIINQVNTEDKIIDVAPIAKASKLKLLDIATPYEGFVELKNLWMLTALRLTDLTLDVAYEPKFISQFKELCSLCLYNNAGVSDFRFLLGLEKLSSLILGVDKYFDTAFLEQIPYLQEIKIIRGVDY